jgi:DNA modification methylase
MKPYYDHKGIQIFLGDCREILPELEPVDLVITSPPYNMRTRIRNGKYTEREQCNHFSKKYSGYHDALPIEKYYEFQKEVISLCLSHSAMAFFNIQIVTGSKEAWFLLIGEYSKSIKDIVVWDKGEGQPAMHERVLNRAYELILIFESEQTAGREFKFCNFDRGTMPDIWRLGRGGKGLIKENGATFPLSLPARVIEGWSRSGDTLLDPFGGSGTTAIIAKKYNRKCIMIEIDERLCEIAARRLSQEMLPFN